MRQTRTATPREHPRRDARAAARADFLPLMRTLVGAYQAFECCAVAHIRELGLKPPEFDVLCTLGNTDGMTLKELGERTLIYKTTLTGVVDRLEAQGLVRRTPHRDDRRCTRAVLTEAGEALFERVFPAHVAHLEARFARLPADQRALAVGVLRRIQALFREG